MRSGCLYVLWSGNELWCQGRPTGAGCRFFWKRTTLLMTFLGSRSGYASKTRLGNLLAASGSNTLENIYFCRQLLPCACSGA